MEPLGDIQRGIFLPNRKIWIEWGANYTQVSAGADEGPYITTLSDLKRCGKIRWFHECLLPLRNDAEKNMEGEVTAFLYGHAPFVCSFELNVSPDKTPYIDDEIHRYYLWMTRLSRYFGDPEVETSILKDGHHFIPPCKWNLSPISINLSYGVLRDSIVTHLSIRHSNYMFY